MYTEHEYYQDRAERDERAAELKARGYFVRKSVARSCVLSPEYVTNYRGHTYPNGFGGCSSQWFSRLYKVEYR